MGQDYEGDPEVTRQLRELREKVRMEHPYSFAEAALRQQDEGLLYGDRDRELFPQLCQHLDELEALYTIREQPFRSGIPILGRFISFFRELWNRISTKWYVLPLIEQQTRFNFAALRVLLDMYHYVQISSMDLVRRMDVLFRTNQQEGAALAARLHDAQAEMEGRQAAIREDIHSLATTLYETSERLHKGLDTQGSELRQVLWQEKARIEQRVQQVAHEQNLDRRGLAFQRMKLDRLMSQVASSAGPATEVRERIESERAGLLDHDYYRFEDLYRREDEVREKQRTYLPYFQGQGEVLDIGCGKGEFLELLRENGIAAYGVDLNEQMVRICQDKGLRAVEDDALHHLAGLSEDSLGGIFAAHLVEHLPVPVLVDLVQQAYARLQPGAALVFETPNPLCLWALVNYFYLDMSHVKPVHPDALAFLLENCGFRDIEIHFLSPVPEGARLAMLPDGEGTPWQEMNALLNTDLERLNNLLYGFSDYAITARK
jgi:SAM-dependent methyltransferase